LHAPAAATTEGYASDHQPAFAVTLFCDKICSMKTEAFKKQIELLSILVDGCKKHPAYRAIRPATGRCKPCVEMWQARQELKDLNK